MKLQGYKLVFVAAGLICVLFIATSALGDFVHLPAISGEERFSELYLLDANSIAENYPFNIAASQNYSVNIDVGNQLGSSAYYFLRVKFGNLTDQMPNDTLGTPSSLQPLYEYRFSIQNGMNWKNLLTFSVSNASIQGTYSQINTLQINGVAFNVDKPAMWDSYSMTFKYQLLFELWIYNVRTKSVEFNDRYLNLQLNLTQATT